MRKAEEVGRLKMRGRRKRSNNLTLQCGEVEEEERGEGEEEGRRGRRAGGAAGQVTATDTEAAHEPWREVMRTAGRV